uniref:(northern house mosquito) hypothetical protein n=1 Tax=Culex pipiens TaxID=7175 RepID=A0A8D8JK66_CULPI
MPAARAAASRIPTNSSEMNTLIAHWQQQHTTLPAIHLHILRFFVVAFFNENLYNFLKAIVFASFVYKKRVVCAFELQLMKGGKLVGNERGTKGTDSTRMYTG